MNCDILKLTFKLAYIFNNTYHCVTGRPNGKPEFRGISFVNSSLDFCKAVKLRGYSNKI